MKHSLKKVFCIFLAVLLLCSMLTMNAFAAAEYEPDTVAIVHYTLGGIEHNDEYSSLSDALAAAYTNDVVYLIKDDTLSTEAEVKAGVTLVIPTSADLVEPASLKTGNDNTPDPQQGTGPFATLSISAGCTLTVNGTLIVAGNQYCHAPNAGVLTGPYGAIETQGDIIVNNELYARGKITGTGNVIANDKSTVYQMLQIRDWRGGNASLTAYLFNGVFPFSLYEVNSITAPTTYHEGATLRGQYFIYAASSGNIGDVVLIGAGGQLEFSATTATKGYITFNYDEATDSTTVHVNGEVTTGNLEVRLPVVGTVTSTRTVCPFGYKMDVVVDENAKLTIASKLKILPGCVFTLEQNANLDVTGEAYFYTADGYKADYNFLGWTDSNSAELINRGATVNVTGTLGSTSETFGNFTDVDYTPNGTATINEYSQTAGRQPVTFYTYTYPAE